MPTRRVARRMGGGARAKSGVRIARMRRSGAIAWVVVAGSLTPWHASGQASARLGAVTAEGRVAYYVTDPGLRAGWVLGVSARRHLRDGRWDSAALDVTRDAGSWHGGAVRAQLFGRYDRIKSPRGASTGAELSWRVSGAVTATWTMKLEVGGPGQHPAHFQGAGAGARVRLGRSVVLGALLRYEHTRRSLKSDLVARIVP